MFISRLLGKSDNSRIVLKNVIGAFSVKGLSLVVSFLTTPIFIHYFNDNRILGIWYTLLAILSWFLNFDLGLGNGIRNHLVKDIAANDYETARKTLSSGMFSIGVATIILSIIGIILIKITNLNSLFNIEEGVISSNTLCISTVYVFVAIMLRFFLTSVSSIFYALQKSAINNFLALCVSILQLFYLLVFKFDNPEQALINVSFAFIFLSNLPIIIAGIIVFNTKLKKCKPSLRYVEKSHIKSIMGIGLLFFICQILYMIIANTNEFFITNLYGAEFTAEYTFYYKLTTIGTMIVSLALTPIWSVVTKAQAEGNYAWLNKLYDYIKLGGLGILFIQFLMVPLIPWLMEIWLGKETVNVSYITATAFAFFSSVFVYSNMLSTIANGLAMLKVQIVSFSVAILFKIVLLLVLYKYTGWSFVVWTNALILLPYIISQQFDLNRFFRIKLKQK